MRRMYLMALTLGILGPASVAGCGRDFPSEAQAMTKTLVVTPVVARAERQTLATVTPYTRQDVASLVLKLLVREGEQETLVAMDTLTNAELDSSVTFGNLRFSRSYRVRAEAYKANGTLISAPETSYVDLVLANDDAPTIATLSVKLVDQTFSGQATSGPIAVTDGGLVPAGVETITQP